MPRQLVLTGPRVLEFADQPTRAIEPDEVRLRSIISGISHGTELNLYRGSAPFAHARFDPELRVFVPAETRRGPARLGYEMVSEVVEVGPGVADVRVGDLLHTGDPHQEETITRLDTGGNYPPVKLPDRDVERGVFLSLTCVALQAVHDAGIKVGDLVAVSGAGVIGLLVTQLARLNGASTVVVLEPDERRRALAVEFGAAGGIDPSADGTVAGVEVKKLLGRRGADVVIETSGTYAGLSASLASAAVGGRIVAAGYYQGGGIDLRLGEEWHHNRLTLISSMGVWGCPHRDYPLWDHARVMRTAVELIYGDLVRVEPLLTETVPFDRAPETYRRLDANPRAALKIALTYGTTTVPSGAQQ